MGFFMNILKLFYAVVCIDLGGSQAAVTQQFFYCVEVGPTVHQMGGKGVPEHVGALFVYSSYQGKVFFYRIVNIARIKFPTVGGNQEVGFVVFPKMGSLSVHIYFQLFHQLGTHRDHPFLASLSQNLDIVACLINLCFLQSDQFRLADTRIIQKFKDQAVGPSIPIIGEFNMVEQQADASCIHKLRKALTDLRRNDSRHWAGRDRSLSQLVFEERFQGRYFPVDGFAFHALFFKSSKPGADKSGPDIRQCHFTELPQKEIKKRVQVIRIGNDGVLRITFLKFQVVEEFPDVGTHGLRHKKTDTQS